MDSTSTSGQASLEAMKCVGITLMSTEFPNPGAARPRTAAQTSQPGNRLVVFLGGGSR